MKNIQLRRKPCGNVQVFEHGSLAFVYTPTMIDRVLEQVSPYFFFRTTHAVPTLVAIEADWLVRSQLALRALCQADVWNQAAEPAPPCLDAVVDDMIRKHGDRENGEFRGWKTRLGLVEESDVDHSPNCRLQYSQALIMVNQSEVAGIANHTLRV